MVGRVWAEPPGFINIALSVSWLQDRIYTIEKTAERYGHNEYGKGERVQVEFVSVNPTGPLHVGHGRVSVLGAGIARVLEADGCDVQREYYLNDAGNQVDSFAKSLYHYFLEACGSQTSSNAGELEYGGQYVKDLAVAVCNELGKELANKPLEQALATLREEGLRRNIVHT